MMPKVRTNVAREMDQGCRECSAPVVTGTMHDTASCSRLAPRDRCVRLPGSGAGLHGQVGALVPEHLLRAGAVEHHGRGVLQPCEAPRQGFLPLENATLGCHAWASGARISAVSGCSERGLPKCLSNDAYPVRNRQLYPRRRLTEVTLPARARSCWSRRSWSGTGSGRRCPRSRLRTSPGTRPRSRSSRPCCGCPPASS